LQTIGVCNSAFFVMTLAFNFKVSVIIPVYNADQYLRRAVTSVLDQEEVTEILIVEDGSKDNSMEICFQLATSDARITLLQHPGKKNRGVSASRNLGIKSATNEYIAFLDADDYYLPNRFKTTLQCFSVNNTIKGVYELVGIHSDELLVKPYSLIEEVSPDELFENLQPIGHKVWFHIDGLTVKKSIFEGTGFFNESLKTSEDTFQWFKMALTQTMFPGNIKEPVALAEPLPDGLSSDKIQVLKDFIMMLYLLFRYCKQSYCIASRKELVLNKLFFYISNQPYKQHYKRTKRLDLFLRLMLTDPVYMILKSKASRRFIGNLIGYNRLLALLKDKKLSVLI
jgi:glycosyltransferase involved in cell wall biosynthesis